MSIDYSRLATSDQSPDDFTGQSLPSNAAESFNLSELIDRPEYDLLVSLLKRAYSGEKAAAFAYQGHAKSVSDQEIRREIEQIERDEWVHRKDVGVMLEVLADQPTQWREVGFGAIGRSLSVLCHVSGFTLPMYFAGKLEASNVEEYLEASKLADRLGLEEMAIRLKEMADTEKTHEEFFKRMLRR